MKHLLNDIYYGMVLSSVLQLDQAEIQDFVLILKLNKPLDSRLYFLLYIKFTIIVLFVFC